MGGGGFGEEEAEIRSFVHAETLDTAAEPTGPTTCTAGPPTHAHVTAPTMGGHGVSFRCLVAWRCEWTRAIIMKLQELDKGFIAIDQWQVICTILSTVTVI